MADIDERAAERLTMDYPVETTPRTATGVVKGRPGRKPEAVRNSGRRIFGGLPLARSYKRDEAGKFSSGGGAGSGKDLSGEADLGHGGAPRVHGCGRRAVRGRLPIGPTLARNGLLEKHGDVESVDELPDWLAELAP